MKRQAKQKQRQPIFAETFSFFLQNLPRGEKQVKWGVLETKRQLFSLLFSGSIKGEEGAFGVRLQRGLFWNGIFADRVHSSQTNYHHMAAKKHWNILDGQKPRINPNSREHIPFHKSLNPAPGQIYRSSDVLRSAFHRLRTYYHRSGQVDMNQVRSTGFSSFVAFLKSFKTSNKRYK